MSRPSITLEDRIADTYFCQDRDDFYKICLANCNVFADSTDDSEYFAFFIRMICHEYLALVLSGKMEPYEIDKSVVDAEMPGFKSTISHVNELLAHCGVPMFEDESGKMRINYDEVEKAIKDDEKN